MKDVPFIYQGEVYWGGSKFALAGEVEQRLKWGGGLETCPYQRRHSSRYQF